MYNHLIMFIFNLGYFKQPDSLSFETVLKIIFAKILGILTLTITTI